jgi:hypothetical protein
MGAEELVNGKAEFHEMEEDDTFSDSELVYHVRNALSSVSSVSILPRAACCLRICLVNINESGNCWSISLYLATQLMIIICMKLSC